MHTGNYAYGSWGMVISMALISGFVILRYLPTKTRLGRRSGGALAAFIVALFAEMYGFPLTIYLLGHFVGIEIPLDHINGHLLGNLITALGGGNGWLIVMIASNALLLVGLLLIMEGWKLVYRSEGELVTHGVYAHIRHPQYTGIFIVTLAFMIQWPTLATLVLWPFVIAMYVRLARREEHDVLAEFPEQYTFYQQRVPMFFPGIGGSKRLLKKREVR
jgi:protein-S-isoprenylcysteine O-methyltransferase Ste14